MFFFSPLRSFLYPRSFPRWPPGGTEWRWSFLVLSHPWVSGTNACWDVAQSSRFLIWGLPTAEVHGPLSSLITEIPALRGLLVPISLGFFWSVCVSISPPWSHTETAMQQAAGTGCFLHLRMYPLLSAFFKPSPGQHLSLEKHGASSRDFQLFRAVAWGMSSRPLALGVPSRSGFSNSSHFLSTYLKTGIQTEPPICPLAFFLLSFLLTSPGSGRALSLAFLSFCSAFIPLPLYPPFILLYVICPPFPEAKNAEGLQEATGDHWKWKIHWQDFPKQYPFFISILNSFINNCSGLNGGLPKDMSAP